MLKKASQHFEKLVTLMLCAAGGWREVRLAKDHSRDSQTRPRYLVRKCKRLNYLQSINQSWSSRRSGRLNVSRWMCSGCRAVHQALGRREKIYSLILQGSLQTWSMQEKNQDSNENWKKKIQIKVKKHRELHLRSREEEWCVCLCLGNSVINLKIFEKALSNFPVPQIRLTYIMKIQHPPICSSLWLGHWHSPPPRPPPLTLTTWGQTQHVTDSKICLGEVKKSIIKDWRPPPPSKINRLSVAGAFIDKVIVKRKRQRFNSHRSMRAHHERAKKKLGKKIRSRVAWSRTGQGVRSPSR